MATDRELRLLAIDFYTADTTAQRDKVMRTIEELDDGDYNTLVGYVRRLENAGSVTLAIEKLSEEVGE